MTPLAVICCLVSSLSGNGPAHEGRRYRPYRDSNGIWTVCAGITGEAVVRGRQYTQAECVRLEKSYVDRMLHAIGKCVNATLTSNEVIAWGHFAYNIGTSSFCRSTAAHLLNQGEHQRACAQISQWVYVQGKNCNEPSNHCRGIVQRRSWERALCEGGQIPASRSPPPVGPNMTADTLFMSILNERD